MPFLQDAKNGDKVKSEIYIVIAIPTSVQGSQ